MPTGSDTVASQASCATNCLAQLTTLVQEKFKLRRECYLMTPNAYASWGSFLWCCVLSQTKCCKASCVDELEHLVKSCYLKNQALTQLGVLRNSRKPRPTSSLFDFHPLTNPVRVQLLLLKTGKASVDVVFLNALGARAACYVQDSRDLVVVVFHPSRRTWYVSRMAIEIVVAVVDVFASSMGDFNVISLST